MTKTAGNMSAINFWIPGFPAPAGSKKAFCIKKGGVYTGRAAVVDSSGKRGLEWRQTVADCAFKEMERQASPPMEGPLFMGLTFHLPRPKSHYGKDGVKPSAPKFHIIRPDCTKLTRAVEDAMTGIVYRDDSQIVTQQITKMLCNDSGCWVTIREIDAPPNDTKEHN